MNINHKNVYDLREHEQAIFAAERKKLEAERAVTAATQAYREKCAKQLDVPAERLQFSNDGCMAKGILRHVFLIKRLHTPSGHHENRCIFCDCDNVDSSY